MNTLDEYVLELVYPRTRFTNWPTYWVFSKFFFLIIFFKFRTVWVDDSQFWKKLFNVSQLFFKRISQNDTIFSKGAQLLTDADDIDIIGHTKQNLIATNGSRCNWKQNQVLVVAMLIRSDVVNIFIYLGFTITSRYEEIE